MGLRDNKMTKQGVRDLNHPIPKKPPAETVPESPPRDPSHLVAPVTLVPKGDVVPAVEP